MHPAGGGRLTPCRTCSVRQAVMIEDLLIAAKAIVRKIRVNLMPAQSAVGATTHLGLATSMSSNPLPERVQLIVWTHPAGWLRDRLPFTLHMPVSPRFGRLGSTLVGLVAVPPRLHGSWMRWGRRRTRPRSFSVSSHRQQRSLNGRRSPSSSRICACRTAPGPTTCSLSIAGTSRISSGCMTTLAFGRPIWRSSHAWPTRRR